MSDIFEFRNKNLARLWQLPAAQIKSVVQCLAGIDASYSCYIYNVRNGVWNDVHRTNQLYSDGIYKVVKV